MHDVPQEVVERDKKLVHTAEEALLRLAKLRWHWTLDPSNDNRVSLTEYANSVGAALTSIRMHARGYQKWLDKDRSTSLSDELEMANLGPHRAYVSEKIAEMYQLSIKTIRQQHRYRELVAEITDDARRKAEKLGTPFETEAQARLDFHAQAMKTREQEQALFRKQHGLRFVGVENELTRAANSVLKALKEAHEVEWNDAERQIIIDSLRKLSSLTQLLDMAVTGTVRVDWDAELAKLGVA